MFLRLSEKHKKLEKIFLMDWMFTTLEYRIVVGLGLFINQICFKKIDEKKNQKMTEMPRLM